MRTAPCKEGNTKGMLGSQMPPLICNLAGGGLETKEPEGADNLNVPRTQQERTKKDDHLTCTAHRGSIDKKKESVLQPVLHIGAWHGKRSLFQVGCVSPGVCRIVYLKLLLT